MDESNSPTAAVAAPHTTWQVTGRTTGAAALIVCGVLLAFLWPTATSTIKDLPVLVAGSGTHAIQVQAALANTGLFSPRSAAGRAEAVELIEQRQAYGAVVLPDQPGGSVEILTATAASPVAAQVIGQVAAKLGPTTVKTTDVVPLSSGDPRGTGLAVAALPLAMGGMTGGVLIAMLVVGPWRRLTASSAYAVVGGAGIAAILHTWFAVLPGSFVATWAVVTASLAATCCVIVGLHSLMGRIGIPIGAILTLFVGNPLSSANAPMEFLPTPWGQVGQGFVPGASATLLRLVNYFPNASTGVYWLTIAVWGIVGVILMLTGRHRRDEVVHVEGAVE